MENVIQESKFKYSKETYLAIKTKLAELVEKQKDNRPIKNVMTKRQIHALHVAYAFVRGKDNWALAQIKKFGRVKVGQKLSTGNKRYYHIISDGIKAQLNHILDGFMNEYDMKFPNTKK